MPEPTPEAGQFTTLVPTSQLRTAIVELFSHVDIGYVRMKRLDTLIAEALSTFAADQVDEVERRWLRAIDQAVAQTWREAAAMAHAKAERIKANELYPAYGLNSQALAAEELAKLYANRTGREGT